MKVSLRVGMRADDPVNPLDGVLRDVKAMGYDGVELMLNTQYSLGALEALIKLVDEIDSPWFGVYEHCYWPRGTMQPHEEIALVGKRIACLHSSALNVQVDYGKMIGALREIGYDHYWVFEVPWEQAQASIDGYRYLMSRY